MTLAVIGVVLSAVTTGAVVLGGSRVASALTANEPALEQQWGMKKIGAPAAWSNGLTGAGITIGVVDSGVDLVHEDLAAKIVPGTDLVEPGTSPQDDFGHGTHVAGIAAAITGNGRGVTGVAPDAAILPVKVLDNQGRGAANIDEGIRWAVDHGAHVVNVSIGDLLEPISGPPFTEAIRYAWSKDVICVVSAGNSFIFNSASSDEPALVVSATTPDDTLAAYSNGVGGAAWGIAAPGGAGETNEADDILSTYWVGGRSNQYAYLSGTSMAAPHVAGAAALLRAAGLTPQQTVDRLLATAKDLGPPGRDSNFGAGRLDVAKAVEGLGGAGGGGSGTGGGAGGGTTTTTASAGGGSGSGGGSSGGTSSGSGAGSKTTRTTAAPAIPTPPTPDTTTPATETPGGDTGALEQSTGAGTRDEGDGASAGANGNDASAGLPLALILAAGALVLGTGSLIPIVRPGRGGRRSRPGR